VSDADDQSSLLESVELFECEVVAGRGRKQTLYLIRFNDSWVAASKHPGARVQSLDPGPGTVWERRIELDLPRGSLLRRIDSAPLPDPKADPLAYLTRAAPKARRRTHETRLRVAARGRLEPDPDARDDAPRAPGRGSG
jgi:hypothetical protein